MNIKRTLIRYSRPAALACALVPDPGADVRASPRSRERASSAGEPGFFAAITRWFDRQTDNLNSSFIKAGKGIENFGHEAGIAARTTVDNAKGAADAVARPAESAAWCPAMRKCRIAANGASDCLAAVESMCKTAGFRSGKSLDMTTAEVCPPKVYLAGRNSGPECHTETFVSRALCQ